MTVSKNGNQHIPKTYENTQEMMSSKEAASVYVVRRVFLFLHTSV